MSRDVSIQVTGVASQESGVERLNTAATDAYREDWEPDDETRLQVIRVTANGEYEPDGGYLGFRRVDVLINGAGGTEIEADPQDGRIATEWVDVSAGGAGWTMVSYDRKTGYMTYYEVDDSGILHETHVPRYAMVTTAPKQEYESADDSVDYTGMVIALYLRQDEVAENFNSGSIEYGTQAWTDYVDTNDGAFADVCKGGLVTCYVRPFWFQNGTELGREHMLRAYYSARVSDAS